MLVVLLLLILLLIVFLIVLFILLLISAWNSQRLGFGEGIKSPMKIRIRKKIRSTSQIKRMRHRLNASSCSYSLSCS